MSDSLGTKSRLTPTLSICIATYNRGKFIGETLDSILVQMESGVELLVVDGASPDNTPEVMAQYLLLHPEIRYYRESENSGVDRDYDKAVGYALGKYCWLMTDDDLLLPNAIKSVVNKLVDSPDLVVVNSEVRNANLSSVLKERCLPLVDDKSYKEEESKQFLRDAGSYLSFIGGVVIRRKLWLARNRIAYFGTLFIHVGVIFQHVPIEKICAIAEPFVVIRYGNAMWTSRGFEIWMFKWPQLVWSFDGFSNEDKECVCAFEPWRNPRQLFSYRARGVYSATEFYRFISPALRGFEWWRAYLIAIFPAKLANLFYVSYFALTNQTDSMIWYEFMNCHCATKLSRWVAKLVLRDEAIHKCIS